MFKAKHYLLIIVTNIVLVAAIVFLACKIIPDTIASKNYAALFIWVCVTILVFSLSLIMYRFRNVIYTKSMERTLRGKENSVLYEFIESLRTCSSLDDFYENVGKILEVKGDCSVLFVDREKDYVLYNSPNKITCNPDVIGTLDRNFKSAWREGYYFIGDDYGVVSKSSRARGFFLIYNQCHLYVFCRYTRLFYEEIYGLLYEEFIRFFRRAKTIDGLAEIGSATFFGEDQGKPCLTDVGRQGYADVGTTECGVVQREARGFKLLSIA